MKMTKDSSEFPGYYIAPKIKATLDKAKNHVIKYDWDRVYIIDGTEGSGKSLLALQLAYYFDPTLNLDRVAFTGDEFTEAIRTAKKNQAIIFDEAFNGLSSTAATSKLNKLIVAKLMECRQKNLFLFIVLPTIFLLQKYVSIFRSRALFHVYVPKSNVRGYYRVYNQKNKKYLYLNGWKFYSYQKPFLRKSQRFYGKYPIDEEAYRAKKLKSIVADLKIEKVDKNVMRRVALEKYLKDNKILTYEQIAEEYSKNNCPLDATNISRGIKNLHSASS